jgi:hypothetical protein
MHITCRNITKSRKLIIFNIHSILFLPGLIPECFCLTYYDNFLNFYVFILFVAIWGGAKLSDVLELVGGLEAYISDIIRREAC